jgi:hypothetical protein
MKTLFKKQQTTKLKETFLKVSFLTFWAISVNSYSQDIILLKSSALIKSKVIEVTDTELKFKNFDNLEGPTRVISKSQVVSITYENGSVDNFQNFISPSDVATKKDEDTSDFAKIRPKSFGGPRVGVTYITSGSMASRLDVAGKGPILTQFGWQFEKRLFTLTSGLSGVVEFVPMIGGVEKGVFLPSCSALIGVRGLGFGKNKKFEFAIGPNWSRSAEQYTYKNTFDNTTTRYYDRKVGGSFGVVIAAGMNFSKENVNFPVTIAYLPSVGNIDKGDGSKYQTGHRISLLIGFNYRKK